jgi:hypothetical protein
MKFMKSGMALMGSLIMLKWVSNDVLPDPLHDFGLV